MTVFISLLYYNNKAILIISNYIKMSNPNWQNQISVFFGRRMAAQREIELIPCRSLTDIGEAV